MTLKRAFLKTVLLTIVLCFSVLGAGSAHAEGGIEKELKAFGDVIFDVHHTQDLPRYMSLLHPDCPLPDPLRLKHNFSSKWLDDKPYDIRLKLPQEVYDFSQLEFQVDPQAVLEFQVWTDDQTEGEIELVTGFGVAMYKGTLKIVDYPCFQPIE